MADEKKQEQLTKSTASAAQGTTNEGEVAINQETPETTSSHEETTETSSSDEETPETPSSDDESSDAHGQTQPYQLGAMPNPSSSASSFKRRMPPLPPSFSRAKIQAVMTNDEHGSGRLHDVPLILAKPSLTPTAAGLPPFSGYEPGHQSGSYGRRYRDFNEMLASVLVKLLQQMPLASTNGGIPDGAITRGFLYGFSDGPVIVCTCHGQFFNAVEFVKHASGLDVENPTGLINLKFFYTHNLVVNYN